MKYNKFSLLGLGALSLPVLFIILAFSNSLSNLNINNQVGYFILIVCFIVSPSLSILFGLIAWFKIKSSGEKGKIISLISITTPIVGFLLFSYLSLISGEPRKSNDAVIKANLANSRAQAALFYENNKTYNGICTSKDGVQPFLLNAIQKLNKKTLIGYNTQAFVYDRNGLLLGSAICHDNKDGWAAIVSLKNPNGYYGKEPNTGWCVDYLGASKYATSLPANAIVCP